MSSPIFTVFTPTYNRAHLLHRVYESLRRQTFRDFEWLIVDDGSTDNTKEVVEGWLRETNFPIRYIWQVNGHKKKAFNCGVKEAKGELFLPWDSDDGAVPCALEEFYHYWISVPPDLRYRFVGVCGLCTNESGDIIGGHFPEDVFDSDSLECRYRYQVTGEKWGFCRTDVLRDYPFPDDVVGHVPEGIVWSAIARRYKTRFINKALRIYYWAPDSITQAGVEKGGAERNAEGHALWARTVLEDEISWFFFNPQWFLKMAANYTRFHFLLQKRQPHKSYPIRGMLPSLLVIMMWPLGYLLYLNDSSGRGSHRP